MKPDRKWIDFSGHDRMNKYLARELLWELESATDCYIYNKPWVITHWDGGYDNIIIKIKDIDSYYLVRLSWNRSHGVIGPICTAIDDVGVFLHI